jgi:hypothetical protein
LGKKGFQRAAFPSILFLLYQRSKESLLGTTTRDVALQIKIVPPHLWHKLYLFLEMLKILKKIIISLKEKILCEGK